MIHIITVNKGDTYSLVKYITIITVIYMSQLIKITDESSDEK